MPKTVIRGVLAAATGGVSEYVRAGQAAIKGDFETAVTGVAGGMGVSSAVGAVVNEKRAPGVPTPEAIPDPAQTAERERSVEEETKRQERRRRQILADQGNLVKTSPLGAAINKNKLGGPTLQGY